jgi:hypothetical protein
MKMFWHLHKITSSARQVMSGKDARFTPSGTVYCASHSHAQNNLRQHKLLADIEKRTENVFEFNASQNLRAARKEVKYICVGSLTALSYNRLFKLRSNRYNFFLIREIHKISKANICSS